MASLLNRTHLKVNNKMTVHIPTIKEIRGKSFYEDGTDEDEKKYYSLLNLFVASPSSLMVELDDMGIDFTTISDFRIFLLLFGNIFNTQQDLSIYDNIMPLIFDNLDLRNFHMEKNKENDQIILYDKSTDTIIDEYSYMRLSTIFCSMHFLEKIRRKPANEITKKYIIERARKKKKSLLRSPQESMLDGSIIAMVNNADFKYNFDTVGELTIYDFNVSVKQIIKKYQVDNLMIGAYCGTVDMTKIEEEKLNWLSWK